MTLSQLSVVTENNLVRFTFFIFPQALAGSLGLSNITKSRGYLVKCHGSITSLISTLSLNLQDTLHITHPAYL